MDQNFTGQLQQTLAAILNPKTESLKEATKILQTQFYSQPQALPALIHILQNSSDDSQKQLAGVEARKLVPKFWNKLYSDMRSEIKNSLVHTTFTEPKDIICHTSARVIAAICTEEFVGNQWPDLVPNLLHASSDENVKVRKTAVFILSSLLESYSPELVQYIGQFMALFNRTLNDSASLEVRSLSVQALNHVSVLIEEQDEINQEHAAQFSFLIPSVVRVLEAVIEAEDAINTKLIFNCLNDFLLLDSQLTGSTIVELVKLALQIAANKDFDDSIKVLAVQFVTSAVSYRKSKILQGKLAPEITHTALKVASNEIDIEEELNNEDETAENEENTPCLTAMRLIAFASTEFPPSQVAAPIIDLLPAMLSSSNPFERRAILLAISVAVAGSPDYILSQLDKIIPATITGIKDSEPIVQLAALKAVSQLTTELQDEVAKFHEEYLPLIISIIDSSKHIVIYRSAILALDGLLEFIAYDAIAKYLEPLMNKLFQMLKSQNSSKLISVIVSAIGSAAFAAGFNFVPYFKTCVEYLAPYIVDCSKIEGLSNDEIELKALTFENISTMGRAVRSVNFTEVAEPLVNSAYEAIKSNSARLRESGYAFIANMAKVYGKEFSPFLETILPEIFKTLQQEEYHFNFDGDNEDLATFADDADEDDLQNKFTVNTGISYEKEVAAAAFSELAIACKEDFLKFVEPALDILKEQVEESYGLKETAIHTIWNIAKAVLMSTNITQENYPKGLPSSSYVDDSVLSVIKTAREVSLDGLSEEFETSMIITIFEDMAEMIKKFGPIIVMDNNDYTYLEQLCLQVLSVIKGEHPCQTVDYEEDVPNDENMDASETEATLLDVALEVLVSLSYALADGYAKVFENFKPILLNLFEVNSKDKRSAAVGAVSEIACGLKEANPYACEFLEAMILRLTSDKSLEVRGNAAYGVGLLIQYANFDVTSIYEPVLKGAYELLTAADQKISVAENDETTKEIIDRAYANATGCVARITLKHQELVPLEHTLPALLAHLPLKTGYEEYDPIFQLIISLYLSNNSLIIKETPRIIELFATVFTKDNERIQLERESTLGREENMEKLKQFQNDEIRLKIVELLKFLNQSYNGLVSQNPILAPIIA